MQATYSKLLLIALFFLSDLSSGSKSKVHPLHVSTTEISFNQAEKTLEISCKIFTDDFENALAKQYKTKVDLINPAMEKAMDALIKQYLNGKLQFNVNGKNIIANYIGFEVEKEATNVYLEIINVANPQKINVNNSILYDLFNDQMNILHAQKAGTTKSVRVNYPEQLMSITFN